MNSQGPGDLQQHYAKIREWLNSHRELGYTEVYSVLCSDEDRIRLTIALLAEHNLLGLQNPTDTSEYLKKHEGISQLHISAADKLMRENKSRQKDSVIEECTKAIVYAPFESKTLALAYGKRAEALLRLRLYEDCIKDVQRASHLDYPKHLQAKLSLVKTQAYAAIYAHDSVTVLKSLEETRQHIKTLGSRHKPKITAILKKIVEGEISRCPDAVVKWNDESHLPRLPKVENPEIPGASEAVAISYSGKYGRHLVATRDIEVGEVLAVQRPYEAILELDRTYKNCWLCLKQTWCGVPCEHCVHVIYCSEKCRERAWQDFHDFECPILGIMIVERFDVTAVMSVRLLIKGWRETGGWLALKDKIEEMASHPDSRTRGFTSHRLDSTKYSSVYTLSKCTEKRTMEDLFRLSVGAATITYLLATITNIFGEVLREERDVLLSHPWVVFAGSIILQHTQIHAVNAQMLCEWDSQARTSWARAMALVPLYGLINHSCNPSVNYTSHGKYMALHAICPIRKGEQIFDHRGVTFADAPHEQRQLQRKENFFFICDCLPCKEDWPLFDDLPSYTQMNLSNVAKKKVDEIMCSHNIFTIMKCHPGMENSMVTPVSIASIIEQLKRIYEYVNQPCREIEEIKRTLHIFHIQSGSRCQSLIGNDP